MRESSNGRHLHQFVIMRGCAETVLLFLCAPEICPGHVTRDVEENKSLHSLGQFDDLSITLQLEPSLKVALTVQEELLPTNVTVLQLISSTAPTRQSICTDYINCTAREEWYTNNIIVSKYKFITIVDQLFQYSVCRVLT